MQTGRSREKRRGVQDIAAKIKSLCDERSDIAAVFLFGSFGTENETRFSDIDLAVLFYQGCVPDLREEMNLADLFSVALARDDVDLVVLNKAPLALRYRAAAEGELIFERDYAYTSDFLAATYKFFLDYDIDRRRLAMEYNRALKEAYGRHGG